VRLKIRRNPKRSSMAIACMCARYAQTPRRMHARIQCAAPPGHVPAIAHQGFHAHAHTGIAHTRPCTPAGAATPIGARRARKTSWRRARPTTLPSATSTPPSGFRNG
jgi:hypothetical protein